MNPDVWAGSGAAALAAGWAAWAALTRPRSLGFRAPAPWWHRRWAAVLARWQSGWSPETRRAVDVIQGSPAAIQRIALGVAAVSALVVWASVSGSGWPGVLQGAVALGIGLVVAYGGVPVWIQSQARTYERRVMADYPVLLIMVRFYLAIEYTPLDALTATVPLLGPHGQRELQRILADIRTGSAAPADALTASRQRIRPMQWGRLMDTLAQNWGRRLKADALRPLSTMLASYRDQAALILTSRLDMVVTLVPILAMFGTLVAGMFIVGTGLLSGSGGFIL